MRPVPERASPPKRLHADDGTYHAAVDIAGADPEAREDLAHDLVDPAVDAEGEAVAGPGDLVEHRVEPTGLPAHDEARAEYSPERRAALSISKACGAK